MEELEIFLDTLNKQVNFFCLSEHWGVRIAEQEIVINDSTLASAFSRSSKPGAGSCIYVRNNPDKVQFRVLPIYSSAEGTFEACAKVLTKPRFILATVYRSPGTSMLENFFHDLDSLLSKLSKGN